MFQQQRGGFLANVPPAVKILLIVNLAMFVMSFFYNSTAGARLQDVLGLHHPKSDFFRPFQLLSHMFMHADFLHIFFNMYALLMFGKYIEMRWGASRFFLYYMITGLGAAALHTVVQHFEIQSLMQIMSQDSIATVMSEGSTIWREGKNFIDPQMGQLNMLLNVPTVGASGAVFGILLAFGMMYPNVEMYLFFIPVPIKAKWLVIGYGALELINGVANVPGDNVAHFAHLGGMLFGFFLIKIWGLTDNRRRN